MDIKAYFEGIEDFRMKNKCSHLLSDILMIGLFTVFERESIRFI